MLHAIEASLRLFGSIALTGLVLLACVDQAPAGVSDAGGAMNTDGGSASDAGEPGAEDGGGADAGRGDGGGGDGGDGGALDAGNGDGGAMDAAVPEWALVTSGPTNRLLKYELNLETGQLGSPDELEIASNPSFIAVHPSRPVLYVAMEQSAEVVAVSVAKATGRLVELNRMPIAGAAPAHVAVDASGRFVLAASYSGHKVVVLPLSSDGRVQAPSQVVSPGQRAHQVVFDPTNRYVFVPCLGSDHVAQFRFDAATGALVENAPALAVAAGAGPRHLAFRSDGRHAYLINELDSTMQALELDGSTGRLRSLQVLSTLPAGFAAANSTAEVQVHPSGNFVYGSNRGHDSIVGYRLDAAGRMTLLGHWSTGGQRPRHFSLDRSGRALLVANQQSGTLRLFSIDPSSGALEGRGEVARVPSSPYAGIHAVASE